MSNEQELIPIEQQTLTFYGTPIIVVRLPDGRPGVVLRFLCENLHIDTNAWVQRVQRSEVVRNRVPLKGMGLWKQARPDQTLPGNRLR